MIQISEQVTIVDRGRGPQLSNSRITVQNLLPLFKENASDAEIFHWYPQIGQTGLDLLRQYYRDHTEEVLTLEREIAASSEEERKRYPRPPLPTDGMTTEEKRAWMLQRIADRKKAELNGVHGSAG
jgi:uncharacterized protein (DUF433 family)